MSHKNQDEKEEEKNEPVLVSCLSRDQNTITDLFNLMSMFFNQEKQNKTIFDV